MFVNIDIRFGPEPGRSFLNEAVKDSFHLDCGELGDGDLGRVLTVVTQKITSAFSYLAERKSLEQLHGAPSDETTPREQKPVAAVDRVS